jgi:ribosomal protein S21
MAEVRRRQWYEKPSATKKREENTARRKLRKLRRIMDRT